MTYSDVYDLNKSGTVTLVKDSNTGELFVRKKLKIYDISVYDFLMSAMPKGIPAIHNFETTDDGLLVIEEYVNGQTLSKRLEEEGPPPLDLAVKYLKEICRILIPLHQNNPPIVHRDIKPSNILITYQGAVYLLDFNAATQYNDEKDRDTVLIGTSGYAAPEQYGFQASDTRADIYAIGRTAQELFTGEKSNPSEYNGPLASVIKKCLQLDPKDRYSSVIELLDAIENEERNLTDSTTTATTNSQKATPSTSNNAEFTSSAKLSKTKRPRNPWLPPGFRTLTPWKMIVASLFYIVFAISMSGVFESHPKSEWFGDIVAILFLLSEMLFLLNYGDIQKRLPLTRSNELPKRVFGIILYMFLIYALIVVLYNVIASMIGLK